MAKKKKQIEPAVAKRPTEERFARGDWAMPQGAMKAWQPVVDMQSDTVAWLYANKRITSDEEQAARQFQAARARYLEEFPELTQFKSCLAGAVPGYDDGDGDAAVLRRYRVLEDLIGVHARPVVLAVCEDDRAPDKLGLDVFKRAMQRVARGAGPRRPARRS